MTLKIRHLRWSIRIVYVWILMSGWVGILFLSLPGVAFEKPFVALVAAIVVGYINAWVRRTLMAVSINPTFVVFGSATLAVNALMLWLTWRFLPGFIVDGYTTSVLLVVGVSFVTVTFSDMLAIDDDDSYYAHLVHQIIKLTGEPRVTDKPGVLFLEIDGLAEPVLRRAIENGVMPTLERWLRNGSHNLVQWECDLSSQTSASQAGIMFGNNFDIPAFRWFEKDQGKRMVSNHPSDTAEIERRLSTGKGLLSRRGASRSNLFSGDAPQAIFTFSTIGDFTRKSQQDFYPLLIGPYNSIRIVLLFILDLIAEWRAARYQRRKDIRPRIHRGGVYPLLRAATTVLMREISVHILMGDMLAGVPCVYTTFVGYDEVAHHSGVERPDAIDVLRKLDDQFDRLEDVAKLAPRPYKFVVLSDHGQSQGATFKQRYGLTLEELTRKFIVEDHEVTSIHSEDAGWGNVNVFLTDLLQDILPGSERIIARLTKRWTKQRMVFGQVVLGPYRDFLHQFGDSEEPTKANVIVMASGNLGLIYFTDWKERLSYEKIRDSFPDLIEGLASHEGIGFLLIQSEEHGPIAIGADGIYYLESDRFEGENPLKHFGPNAASHLSRTNGFPHVGDIMVNSLLITETDEVAAFEELVGSHGGLGGNQCLPFLLHPSDWTVDGDRIVGAEQLHQQLIQWLDQLGETESTEVSL